MNFLEELKKAGEENICWKFKARTRDGVPRGRENDDTSGLDRRSHRKRSRKNGGALEARGEHE